MKWRNVLSSLFGAMMLLAGGAPARAAGGEGPEAMVMDNMCMVMFGYDMIHITSYLPGISRDQYCNEIPSTGKIITTFDIENPKFRDLPIEIRIIRDPLTPVTADTQLDPLTEVYFPPKLYKKGTFSFEHEYTKNGHYIGMVTLTKENGEKETQIFKFAVGETLWGYMSYILGSVAIGLTMLAYWRHSHPAKKPAQAQNLPA